MRPSKVQHRVTGHRVDFVVTVVNAESNKITKLHSRLLIVC